jgi:hypothetical protein
MTQDEIIEMARKCGWNSPANNMMPLYEFAKLIAAKAIAELESQKPVKYEHKAYTMPPQPETQWQSTQAKSKIETVPAQGTLQKRTWVGLTDDEVESYWDWEDFQIGAGRSTILEMVRDIEAKLKQKNGFAEQKNSNTRETTYINYDSV